MIRGVGRGFIGGVAGVVLIVLFAISVLVCCACWCKSICKRLRRSSEDSEDFTDLHHSSPKFLKLLAQRENHRRRSSIGLSLQKSPPPTDLPTTMPMPPAGYSLNPHNGANKDFGSISTNSCPSSPILPYPSTATQMPQPYPLRAPPSPVLLKSTSPTNSYHYNGF